MKKIFVCLLALALAISPFAINASAAQTMQDVTVYYYPGSKASDVVSVDIEWGSMEFSYYDEIEGTWNPNTHQFDGAVPARWEVVDSSNYVTVTNHSNKAVTASLSLSINPDYSSVTGQFDVPTLSIPTAVGTTSSNSPSATARLSLTGEMNIDSLNQTAVNSSIERGSHVIGTIFVSISN